MKQGLLILATLVLSSTVIAATDVPMPTPAPATTTQPSNVTAGPLPADANSQPSVKPVTVSPISTAKPTAAAAAAAAAPTTPVAPAASGTVTPTTIYLTPVETAPTTPAAADAPGVTPANVQNNGSPIPSFVGVYHCKGVDPYLNKDYTGTVTVTQQNTVYKLSMQYDTGEIAVGTGGLYDKYLMSVVFQDSQDPKKVGLEQYHFTPDYKTMSGYWVYLGKDKLGKEICTKV